MVEGLIFAGWSGAVDDDIKNSKKAKSFYSDDLTAATEMLRYELGKVTVSKGLNIKNTEKNDKEIQDLLEKISFM